MGTLCIILQFLMNICVLLTNCKKLSGYSIQDEKCYALVDYILLHFLATKLYTKYITLKLEQNVST